MNGFNYYGMNLPQQQAVQVNGKASAEKIQLAPNSSMLAIDTTAPIVWLFVTDAAGAMTRTAYDIALHQEPQPVDVNALMAKMQEMEEKLNKMTGGVVHESDDASTQRHQDRRNPRADT